MSFAPGTRVGPYEIVSAIGAGGMGEVYRATDTNLKRAVAIKVLPDLYAADPDRLARFQREAELLGALNAGNIAQIYGVERTGDSVALVLELVDGETLADRIARGPLALEEALPIAKQIADALDAAHQRGIIHRDLKPANVKVRSDGTVKVLWSALPANTPAPIRRLMRRCLEKDRTRRLESAADARLEIEEASTPSEDSAFPSPAAARRASWRRTVPWAIAALLAIGLLAVVVSWAPWRTAAPVAPVRLNADLGVDGSLATDQGPAAVLSPDGEAIVFASKPTGGADSQLFVRRLRDLQASPLAGTEGARNPFFSPDGQWIAFFAGGKRAACRDRPRRRHGHSTQAGQGRVRVRFSRRRASRERAVEIAA